MDKSPSSNTERVAVDYRCAACGFKDRAQVEAAGKQMVPVRGWKEVLGEERLKEKDDRAVDKNAHRLAGCATCPACGAVDRAHLGRLRVNALLFSLGCSLALVLAAWIVLGARTDPQALKLLALATFSMLVVLSLPIFLITRSLHWARADEKVHFDSVEKQ